MFVGSKTAVKHSKDNEYESNHIEYNIKYKERFKHIYQDNFLKPTS